MHDVCRKVFICVMGEGTTVHDPVRGALCHHSLFDLCEHCCTYRLSTCNAIDCYRQIQSILIRFSPAFSVNVGGRLCLRHWSLRACKIHRIDLAVVTRLSLSRTVLLDKAYVSGAGIHARPIQAICMSWVVTY
jgi:hypothetical protein